MKFICLFQVASVFLFFLSGISSFTLCRKCCQNYRISNPYAMRERLVGDSRLRMAVEDNETEVDGSEPAMEVEEEEELEVMDTEVVSATVAETPAIELDPYAVAVKALEVELAGEITTKETILKAERNSLSRAKDKASESGKNGYFMIQAKVAEFQKNKAVEQKSRVTKNKREFVLKMLPVVDAFRAAPLISTSSTDREISMHKSFGSLLESILVVFEKYGFKEYDADIGAVLVPSRHQVSEVVEGEVDGIVLSQSKRGIVDKDGEVLRRALVVTTKAPSVAKAVDVPVAAEPVEAAEGTDL